MGPSSYNQRRLHNNDPYTVSRSGLLLVSPLQAGVFYKMESARYVDSISKLQLKSLSLGNQFVHCNKLQHIRETHNVPKNSDRQEIRISSSAMKLLVTCTCLNISRTSCEHHGVGILPIGALLIELRQRKWFVDVSTDILRNIIHGHLLVCRDQHRFQRLWRTNIFIWTSRTWKPLFHLKSLIIFPRVQRHDSV